MRSIITHHLRNKPKYIQCPCREMNQVTNMEILDFVYAFLYGHVELIWHGAWGFREPGEWGSKQPESQEHDEKKFRDPEQGTEEII